MTDTMPDGTESRTLTYPRDAFGHKTGIFDQRPSIGWTGWDIWFAQVAGQRINMGGSTSWLLHSDALGSSTMETDQTGAVDWDGNFYPWGQPWHSGNGEVSFADLGYPVNEPVLPSATRGYNPTLGRWMTPDPGGVKVVKLSDPQTWNMYAYAGDNPVTFNDPSGLQTDADRIKANYGYSHGEQDEKVHGVKSQADRDAVQGLNLTITLTVQRTTQTVHSTEGTFTLSSSAAGSGTDSGYTLEPPAHPDPEGNGSTRIPAGTYGATLLGPNQSKVHAVLLLAVPGHRGIEVHPGNYSGDTRGCILPGTAEGANFVGNSRTAVKGIRNYINRINSTTGGKTTIIVVVKNPTQ